MNLHVITLVQDSLALLLEEEETALALFQDRLDVLDPALRALLTAGVAGGSRELLVVLTLGIRGLNVPESVIPALKAIGRDHTRQGIQPHHYQPIGEAMLWAVAQLQGDHFDGALASAWAEAFYLIAGLMKEAACEPPGTSSHSGKGDR